MTLTLFLAAATKTLSAANVQLIWAVLFAVSEVLGADPRIKSNGIISFLLIQAQNFIRGKKDKV